MGRLDGRVAIITGAAQGLGATYAKAFAVEGAAVAVNDVADPTTMVNIIRQHGGRAIAAQGDVTDAKAVKAMVDKTIAEFGKVDILVNNASLASNVRHVPFWELTEDEWDRVMQVNVRGMFQCAKAVIPDMKSRAYGKIVNVSSSTVQRGVPFFMHYVTSKSAIIGMTRAMANELGEFGICVNSLAPGLTASEGVLAGRTTAGAKRHAEEVIAMRAFKREEMPEDMVGACLFLASADSDFMTGNLVQVSGGESFY
jgi:NAD(P)-dependent dehydrogenase (short-subunit alcohol dehydrogenase family)